jgi:lipopolysaccharide/colanic/teichoic acid biosynthesis glycosyltransferase
MKRLLDILIAGVGIAVFLPLGLGIALILRFTGEGEIFFRQPRVGRGGKLFGLLKFATMLKNSPSMSGGSVTVKNDPRVLPIGGFLRKTKINEIPQLWNVLVGDMSIVGPRPLTPQTFAYYSPDAAAGIVTLTPGLTGLGSIVFRDEEEILARSSKPAHQCYREEISPRKAALELWYLEHRTFWLDLMLIFFTAMVVIHSDARFVERWLPGVPYEALRGRTTPQS